VVIVYVDEYSDTYSDTYGEPTVTTTVAQLPPTTPAAQVPF
jgi:hypothetical protein